MKAEDLYKAMEGIDDELILRSEHRIETAREEEDRRDDSGCRFPAAYGQRTGRRPRSKERKEQQSDLRYGGAEPG